MAHGTQLHITSASINSTGLLTYEISGANPGRVYNQSDSQYGSGMVQIQISKLTSIPNNIETLIENRITSEGGLTCLGSHDFGSDSGIVKSGDTHSTSYYQPEYNQSGDLINTGSHTWDTSIATNYYDAFLFSAYDQYGNYDFGILFGEINLEFGSYFGFPPQNVILYNTAGTVINSSSNSSFYGRYADGVLGILGMSDIAYPSNYNVYRSTAPLTDPTTANIASQTTVISNALQGSSEGMGFPDRIIDNTITDVTQRYYYYYINDMAGYDEETGSQISAPQMLCSAEIVVETPPLDTPEITITTTTTTATVTFGAITNAVSYLIRYCTSSELGTGTKIAGTGTAYTSGTVITGLTQGTNYYFQVQALKSSTDSAHTDSAWSVVTVARTKSQLNTPACTITTTTTTATVTYEAVANAVSYKIRYGTENPPTGDGEAYASGTILTGLTQNTTYYYQLQTVGDNVNYLSSDWGSVITQATLPPPDTTAPVVTLTGDATINLANGSSWIDPGATATDETDGTLTVTTSGTVDTQTAGTYTITYSATDAAGNTGTATRSVIVAAAIPPDTTAPVITLTGDATVNLANGASWIDPGATAMDETDGTLTVTTSGTVDTQTAGTYTITYSATDAAGNTGTATRSVIVAAVQDPTLTQLTAPIVTATATTTSITPTWASIANAASYKIRYGTSNPPTGDGSTTTSGIAITGLTAETTYYLQVMAIGDGSTYSDSDWSTVVTQVTEVASSTDPETDTTAPVITLAGDATINLAYSATWTDPGATATDDTDGSLTVSVSYTFDGSYQTAFDSKQAGTWTITYTVTDDAGNTGTATRTVIVATQYQLTETTFVMEAHAISSHVIRCSLTPAFTQKDLSIKWQYTTTDQTGNGSPVWTDHTMATGSSIDISGLTPNQKYWFRAILTQGETTQTTNADVAWLTQIVNNAAFIQSESPIIIKRGECAICKGRIINGNGNIIMPDEIQSIHYTIYKRPVALFETDNTVINGYNNKNVEIFPTVLKNPVMDDYYQWDTDEIGYNFLHSPNHEVLNPFPEPGFYAVTYEIIMCDGRKVTPLFNVNMLN